MTPQLVWYRGTTIDTSFTSAKFIRNPQLVRLRGGLVILLAIGLFPFAANAQELSEGDPRSPMTAVDAQSSVELSPEELQARIEQAENAAELGDALRQEIVKLYRSALTRLGAAERFEAAAGEYRAFIGSAPSLAEDLRDQIQRGTRPDADPRIEPEVRTAALPRLEAVLLASQTKVADLSEQVTARAQKITAERARPDLARQRIAELDRDISAMGVEALPPGDSGSLEQARRVAYTKHLRALRAERAMLEQELLSNPTRIDLLVLNQELANRELTRAKLELAGLENLVGERRRIDAERNLIEAHLATQRALGKHPVLQSLLEANARLSVELADIVDAGTRTQSRLEEIAALDEEIQYKLDVTRRRIEIAGINFALGDLLIEQRNALPDLRHYRAGASDRDRQVSEFGLLQIRVSEERRKLRDLNAAVDTALAHETDFSLTAPDEAALRGDVLESLARQRELLKSLGTAVSREVQALTELDFRERQLIETASGFRAFIDEELFRIPSSPVATWSTLTRVPDAIATLVSVSRWRSVKDALDWDASIHPILYVAAVALGGALLLGRRAFKRRLRTLGQRCQHLYSDRFSLSMRALGGSVLMAAGVPLLLAFVGWRLIASSNGLFPIAVGEGLLTGAEFLLLFLIYRGLLISGGLAEAHFRWDELRVRRLRAHLTWFIPVAAPMAFVVTVTAVDTDAQAADSLGRLSLVLLNLALAAFAWFGFRRAVYSVAQAPTSGFGRMWLRIGTLLGLALAILPLLNAGLALYGFQYTAATLTENLSYTLWIALAAMVLRDLFVRWGVLAHRRIELQRKRERYAARLGDESEDEADDRTDLLVEMDPEKLNQQTRRLVYIGLSGIIIGLFVFAWSEVLPAFTILDEFELWQGTSVVAGEEQVVPITVADLLMTVLLVVAVAFVARNMAAILDLLQFNRLSLDAGARYAFTTLVQYAVVIVGVFAAFGELGVYWSDVQWLAAAVTVGLGFGLQEIFANFVSGLIILFERPMRIGDTVEVGNVMGTVTRFRIRATTITDWDNKEIVVPNKTFITNELTNWTLSEQVIRAVMHVGVALDADSDTAHRVMLDVARANPRVLADPAPTVYFLGLGEHSQNFDVRVFVDHIDDWIPVRHEFYSEVMKALRQNGIEVPYPKRDIRVRSVSELGGRDIYARNEPGTAA